MKSRRPARPFPLAAILVAFCTGVLVDWTLRTYGPPQPVDAPTQIGPTDSQVVLKPDPTGMREQPKTTGDEASAAPGGSRATTGTSSLRLPIDGMKLDGVKGGFFEPRGGHRHEAIDILAPRNTPVHAVENGTIARLFLSKQGGLTVYQNDPTGRYCYYYAHLERYADHLQDGDAVSQGQVIGYVGTSGNAPPNTPHLHFAVFEVADDHSWWNGRAIDPYPFLKERAKG
jgi:murein DD-endopeptidase MepM/ murein hydrolase activator NlpD